MFCFVMQPWKAIRGSTTITTVTQSESCWLDLTPYQDVVAWLEVKQVSPNGGTNVQMAYQTSPTKDETLFQAVTAAFNMATGVTTTIMLKDAATVSLSRYLRWQLSVTGTPTGPWDATFRIFIAANVIGRGRPATLTAAVATTGSTPPTPPLHTQAPQGGSGGGTFTPGSANTVVVNNAPPGQQPTATGNAAVLSSGPVGAQQAFASFAPAQLQAGATPSPATPLHLQGAQRLVSPPTFGIMSPGAGGSRNTNIYRRG
jgi:hypothetical protein